MNVVSQVDVPEFPPSVHDYFATQGKRFCTAAGHATMVATRAASGWYAVFASEITNQAVLGDLKKYCGARITRDDTIDMGGAILYECTDRAFYEACERKALLDGMHEHAPTRALEERDEGIRRETGNKVYLDLEMARSLGMTSAHAIGGAQNADAIRNLAKADLGLKEEQ